MVLVKILYFRIILHEKECTNCKFVVKWEKIYYDYNSNLIYS